MVENLRRCDAAHAADEHHERHHRQSRRLEGLVKDQDSPQKACEHAYAAPNARPDRGTEPLDGGPGKELRASQHGRAHDSVWAPLNRHVEEQQKHQVKGRVADGYP